MFVFVHSARTSPVFQCGPESSQRRSKQTVPAPQGSWCCFIDVRFRTLGPVKAYYLWRQNRQYVVM